MPTQSTDDGVDTDAYNDDSNNVSLLPPPLLLSWYL